MLRKEGNSMKEKMKWATNTLKGAGSRDIQKVLDEQSIYFHQSFSEYKKTPLVRLSHLAKEWGLGQIYVKDESKRFNLNSFKVLGASYAIGKTLANYLGKDLKDLSFDYLKSEEASSKLKGIKLLATTDGNHGRGVAWTARQLGLEVFIYMPKGTTQKRIEHIESLGATVETTQLNYDDTIRYMCEQAKGTDWLIVQDTSWEGYEEVPVWIMQGYCTIASEILGDLGEEKPTHLFLQAGVGAFAGAISDAFATWYKDAPPKVIVVEAEEAACFYDSFTKKQMTSVGGELTTIMAGLACGEPNPLGWQILKQQAEGSMAVADSIAANGMRILGNPLRGDEKITAGECGGVTIGTLNSLMTDPVYKQLKEALSLNETSKVLCISTEGDTDPGIYKEVVWHGKYSNEER